MPNRTLTTPQNMKPETIESLQELVRALNDSTAYHIEAADKISDDEFVANTLRAVAAERHEICEELSGYVTLADESPAEEGTFMGNMRSIWTTFRAGLNSGDATVVLIEAEKAEDVIVNKFMNVLPEIAGNPINDKLNEFFMKVKSGHDRVLGLRNAYQNS